MRQLSTAIYILYVLKILDIGYDKQINKVFN